MAETPPPSPSITILIIDGNDSDRQYYAQRLRTCSSDYHVLEAADGRTGLEVCRSRSLDCVILELDLPDMSGFQVLLELVPSACRPAIAVIVLTLLRNPDLLDLAKKNGAQAAFHKAHCADDILDKTILKAISTVGAQQKERPR